MSMRMPMRHFSTQWVRFTRRVKDSNRSADTQTRTLLLFGFGGLLVLLAFTGLNALSVVRNIQSRSDRVRQEYLDRDRMLEQIRSDLYVSGTYVRDLLLDPDPRDVQVHRRDFYDARSRVESTLREYGALLRPEQAATFQKLSAGVNTYFNSLEPAVLWSADERSRKGYAFTENAVLPGRLAVLALTDRIGMINVRQLEAGNQQVAELFSRFRRTLVGLLVGSLILGLALAGVSIYRVLNLEHLSERRLAEAIEARTALRDLSARLLEVQESERRAISRELHDEVGQQVSALLLAVGNVGATLSPASVEESKEQLQDIRRVAERTLATVRDMSLLLRPSMLDDLGLIPALEWQAREVLRTSGLRVTINAPDIPDELADEQKTCIYRVVQEALRNVTRHSRARAVEVTLNCDGPALQLTIHDDGQGFSPERQKGLGLLGIQERVLRLNGSVQIQSQPGSGTTLIVEMPILRDNANLVGA